MKWVVVSDNHGDATVLETIYQTYSDHVQTFIHCGDSELGHEQLSNYYAVRGNCDVSQQLPLELTVEADNQKFLVVHGHIENCKMSLLQLSYKAQAAGVSFAFFGHSHLYGAEKIGDIIYCNPGSISLPRGGNAKTYAVIEFSENAVVIVFKNERHEEVDRVTF